MQCAYRLSGVARTSGRKVNALPILDQNPQRKPVPRPPRPFGCHGLFALGSWITPLSNVAHDGRGSCQDRQRHGHCGANLGLPHAHGKEVFHVCQR